MAPRQHREPLPQPRRVQVRSKGAAQHPARTPHPTRRIRQALSAPRRSLRRHRRPITTIASVRNTASLQSPHPALRAQTARWRCLRRRCAPFLRMRRRSALRQVSKAPGGDGVGAQAVVGLGGGGEGEGAAGGDPVVGAEGAVRVDHHRPPRRHRHRRHRDVGPAGHHSSRPPDGHPVFCSRRCGGSEGNGRIEPSMGAGRSSSCRRKDGGVLLKEWGAPCGGRPVTHGEPRR